MQARLKGSGERLMWVAALLAIGAAALLGWWTWRPSGAPAAPLAEAPVAVATELPLEALRELVGVEWIECDATGPAAAGSVSVQLRFQDPQGAAVPCDVGWTHLGPVRDGRAPRRIHADTTEGLLELELPPGRLRVLATSPGYEPAFADLLVEERPSTHEVTLLPAGKLIVEIEDSHGRFQGPCQLVVGGRGGAIESIRGDLHELGIEDDLAPAACTWPDPSDATFHSRPLVAADLEELLHELPLVLPERVREAAATRFVECCDVYDGRREFPSLAAGVYSVFVRAESTTDGVAHGVEIHSGETTTVTLQLRAALHLHGRVLLEGQGVRGAEIQVWHHHRFAPLLVHSDAEGRFEVPIIEKIPAAADAGHDHGGAAPEVLSLKVAYEDRESSSAYYLPRRTYPFADVDWDGETVLELLRGVDTVRVRVVDARGTPVADADVLLDAGCKTGPDGVATFHGVADAAGRESAFGRTPDRIDVRFVTPVLWRTKPTGQPIRARASEMFMASAPFARDVEIVLEDLNLEEWR